MDTKYEIGFKSGNTLAVTGHVIEILNNRIKEKTTSTFHIFSNDINELTLFINIFEIEYIKILL